MSLIEATAVRCQTMADGTLRLVVDIEPRHARGAFSLFCAPGTAMALAAINVTAADEEEPAPARQPGGVLSKWAAIRCGEAGFQSWLMTEFPAAWDMAHGNTSAQRAASVIRAVCSIDSRAELDNDKRAESAFHALIRGPYSKHNTAVTA